MECKPKGVKGIGRPKLRWMDMNKLEIKGWLMLARYKESWGQILREDEARTGLRN